MWRSNVTVFVAASATVTTEASCFASEVAVRRSLSAEGPFAVAVTDAVAGSSKSEAGLPAANRGGLKELHAIGSWNANGKQWRLTTSVGGWIDSETDLMVPSFWLEVGYPVVDGIVSRSLEVATGTPA